MGMKIIKKILGILELALITLGRYWSMTLK